jgi:hypothetical protein
MPILKIIYFRYLKHKCSIDYFNLLKKIYIVSLEHPHIYANYYVGPATSTLFSFFSSIFNKLPSGNFFGYLNFPPKTDPPPTKTYLSRLDLMGNFLAS